jgi:hypothetical protein
MSCASISIHLGVYAVLLEEPGTQLSTSLALPDHQKLTTIFVEQSQLHRPGLTKSGSGLYALWILDSNSHRSLSVMIIHR